MYYLAGKYAKQLQRQIELKEGIPKVTDCDVLCIQIAALCYNLGFGPFPYIFEMFLDEAAKINQVEKPWKVNYVLCLNIYVTYIYLITVACFSSISQNV